ncbi:ribonuclease H-like domain-containing protein, partial [Tanacetum coccineum]
RVKVIRCDNGTEFKNKEVNQFCERKADSKPPTTFLAEVVNNACYVQNKVLVTKPHNKTPYELFLGRKPALGFMRPFGCPVTILDTIDHLGKFDGTTDEGFFVGYSINTRKKHFAAMRAQEMRNKPPTKAQKRNTMSTYLKNMVEYKHNQLKNKRFDDIQKLFDKAMKRVNTFVDLDTELVEGSEVRQEQKEVLREQV